MIELPYWIRFASLTLLVVVVGCGETKRDVIARQRPQFATLRTKLKALPSTLPPKGSVTAPSKPQKLNPVPEYDGPGRRGNVEILMEGQLLDIYAPLDLDLGLSRDLATCLAWTGDNNPLAESALASSAGGMDDEFRRAIGYQYLVVVREVRFEPPQLVGDSQYVGGNVELEVFLLQALDHKVVGAFPVRATAADQVGVTYKEGDSKSDRSQAFVKSSMWTSARQQVAAGLSALGGGSFKFGP